MKVFVIGVAGGVGRRVAQQLARKGNRVTGLIRRPEQGEVLTRDGIDSITGDLVAMSIDDLAEAMRGSDAIVFSAGAGGRDGPEATTKVDGDGPLKLAQAADLAGVRRFILVSVFPEAWRERRMDSEFEHYMVEKKKAEISLVATNLDWVILRPSALTEDPGAGTVDLGIARIHDEISRDDVASTIVAILDRPAVNRVILEVTAGNTPIGEAVLGHA